MFGMASWAILIKKQFNSVSRRPASRPPGALSAFEELVSDPWFQSTWTLQEAIRRPNMFMIGRDEKASYIFFPHGSLEDTRLASLPMQIEEFRKYVSILRVVAMDAIRTGPARHTFITPGSPLIRPQDALWLEQYL